MNLDDARAIERANILEKALLAVIAQGQALQVQSSGLIHSLGEEGLGNYYDEDGEVQRYMLAGDEAGVYVVKP